MFFSAYGLNYFNEKPSLTFKAVNFQTNEELTFEGQFGGEDSPFAGRIAAWRVGEMVIPFILTPPTFLCWFNLTEPRFHYDYPKSSTILPVVSRDAVTVGFDTGYFDYQLGPRSFSSYPQKLFQNRTPYHLEDIRRCAEAIKQGLSIMMFDRYIVGNFIPSLYVRVEVSDERLKPQPTLSPVTILEIKALASELATRHPVNGHGGLLKLFSDANSRGAQSLEWITACLLSDERRTCRFGANTSSPRILLEEELWTNSEFIKMLKSSYEAFYTSLSPNFSDFVTLIVNLMRNRRQSRLDYVCDATKLLAGAHY